ncbi:hypothetical protein CerSpe_259200 [Prunus speciosa]
MLSFVCAALMVLYVPLPPEEHFSEFLILNWFEEQLEADLKWSFALNGVLHAAASEFQDIVLLDTKRFGKALVIDGKLQSDERDEFIYHECLVHLAFIQISKPTGYTS